jgi:hypothetical protein
MLLFARRPQVDVEGTKRPRCFSCTVNNGLHAVRFQNLCWRLTHRHDETGFDNLPSSLQGLVDDHDTTNVDVRRSTGCWRSISSPDVSVCTPVVGATGKAQVPHSGSSRKRGVSFSESHVEIPVLESARGKRPRSGSENTGCVFFVLEIMVNQLVRALPAPECTVQAARARCPSSARH